MTTNTHLTTNETLANRGINMSGLRAKEIKEYCALPHRVKLQGAFKQMTMDMQPTAWFTFATNSQCTADDLRNMLKHFFARLDRKRLGKLYYQQPSKKRCDGILTIEKVKINTHSHGAICIPLNEIRNLVEPSKQIWKKICPAGSVKIDVMNDRELRSKYMGKEQGFLRHYDFETQVVLLSEFHSQK